MGFDPVSRLLFPAPPTSYDENTFPGELLWIPRLESRGAGSPKKEKMRETPPEEKIPCLFLKYTSARFIVFYLHTNAEDLGKCHAFCSCLRAQFQVHVFAVEYPGYGICPGGPCDENGLTENAIAGLHFVRRVLQWPLDSILIVGRSIGCGPAISLAVRHQVAGVIIISPMLSFRELCKDLVGPLASVVTERFPNKSRMLLVRSSVLVVHGQKDITIPYRHGLELFRICKSRKLFVGPEDMGHNTNMFANVSYMVMPMLHFFALPDYCFDDLRLPTWAYDRYASLDGQEPEVPISVPARVVAPWEDALGEARLEAGQELNKKPPRQATQQTPSTDVDKPPTALQPGEKPAQPEAHVPTGPVPEAREPTGEPVGRPAPVAPARAATIRVPPRAEQERTASRSLLAAVSDKPLPMPTPVSHEAVIPPHPAGDETEIMGGLDRLPHASSRTEYLLRSRLPFCCSCPATYVTDTWEAYDRQAGTPPMKGELLDSSEQLEGSFGWGEGL